MAFMVVTIPVSVARHVASAANTSIIGTCTCSAYLFAASDEPTVNVGLPWGHAGASPHVRAQLARTDTSATSSAKVTFRTGLDQKLT
jgi:hypothetical protein